MLEGFMMQMAPGLGKGLGQGLGEAIGGGGGPAISGAHAAAYGTTLNGSGWVVNLGSGAKMDGVTASPTSSSGTSVPGSMLDPLMGGSTQAGMSWLPMLLLVGGAVAILRARKGG